MARRASVQVDLLGERSTRMRLLAQDGRHALAALAVDVTRLPVIAVGDSRPLRPGEPLLAIGHPWV